MVTELEGLVGFITARRMVLWRSHLVRLQLVLALPGRRRSWLVLRAPLTTSGSYFTLVELVVVLCIQCNKSGRDPLCGC